MVFQVEARACPKCGMTFRATHALRVVTDRRSYVTGTDEHSIILDPGSPDRWLGIESQDGDVRVHCWNCNHLIERSDARAAAARLGPDA
jgi:uncharacterized C2H2 Zn-finger protein